MDANGEPQAHRIPRDDARDLEFTGWLLGEGTVTGGRSRPDGDQDEYEKSMTCALYLTSGGYYVVHESRERDWGNLCSDSVTVIPATHPDDERSPEERLLSALHLGSATRDAWNQACDAHKPLAALATERIP